MKKRAPLFYKFYLVWFQTHNIIYLFIEISYFLHFGTHPSKTGEELLYYHLNYEESPFHLDVDS